jgi:hypothetical protein
MTDDIHPSERDPSWGTCNRPDCDYACPEDKVAILLDEAVYCSPDCAHAALDAADEVPTRIALHDPEFHANRGSIPVSDDSVSIWRHVRDAASAERTIDEIDDLYPMLFRAEEPSS